MSELDTKISEYRSNGWTVKERVGDHQAVMVKRTWGSKLAHFGLLLCTAGIGNLIYGLWSRFISSEKTTVEA